MKIKITRERIFALLVLLPYLENNFLQRHLDVNLSSSAYIKAVIFLMLAAMLVMLLTQLKYKWPKPRYYDWLFVCFTIATLLYSVMTAASMTTSFSVWLWVCVPMMYAGVAVIYARQSKMDFTEVLMQMARYFALYVAVVVVYYVLFKKLFINSSIRMSPRGGGAVIFGYTIAVVFALMLQLKPNFRSAEYYLILVILTVGALGTKSRASIWPIAFCWVANYAFLKMSRKKMIFILLLIPVLISLGQLDFSALFSSTSYVGWQRLFNVHSLRRAQTISSAFGLEMRLPAVKKLLGFGLGNFFPYLRWVININNVEDNMFLFSGQRFLVQPHNSFLYFMLETGILGLICILAVFFISFGKLRKKREEGFLYQVTFLGVLFIVNCVDSVFFVQPGVAGTLWMLLLLVVERHLQVVNQRSLALEEPDSEEKGTF